MDEQTAEECAENLGTNVKDLHVRLKQKRYRALPVKRVGIDKDDGKRRPIGITAFEDKIVQRAAVTILEQIYEQDFYEFSQGYRRGKGAHKIRLNREEVNTQSNVCCANFFSKILSYK